VRTDKLEEMCWNGIDVLERQNQQQQNPNRTGGEGGVSTGADGSSSSLSPEEEEYVRQYSDLLAAYKGRWTDIDLTGSMEPPKDLFIDVRVLKDAGEIQTEYGYVQAACIRVFILTGNQCNHLDQEQPVFCTPRRRRALDRPRIPPAPELKAVLYGFQRLHHTTMMIKIP
jgi:hypothetical protein